ncbi:MAG: hypothetical protein Q8P28_03465 [Deltaproteobacteria bacterium]|nr:hypothetical protein [Deltaproteobacteria bacterium]
MRRLYRGLIICLIGSAISSTLAYAGEYHNPRERTSAQTEDTLACAQCHAMHGSQGAGATAGSLTYNTSLPGIYPKLLRAATVLELCLFCHGDVSPGVVASGNRTPPQILNNQIAATYIPSAGDFADGGYVNQANRHSIGLTDFAVSGPPGNNNAAGWNNGTTNSVVGKFGNAIVCIYCHDQHGNRNYRNFRYDPGNPVNDNPTTGVQVSYRMDATGNCSDGVAAPCDVDNSTADFALYGNRAKYQRKSVVFNMTTGRDHNRVSEWCGKCHTKFFDISNSPTNDTTGPYLGGTAGAGVGSGDTNVNTPWKRHPVGDVNLGQGVTNMHVDFNASSYSSYINKDKVRVVADTITNPTSIAANDAQPFCLSCHYSHGGGNPNRNGTTTLDHSNLVMLGDGGELNLKGPTTGVTYRMRNTCLQCHNQ